MTEFYTLQSDHLTARFQRHGARMRALHFEEGPNLILDSDAAEFVSAYGGVLIGPVANRVHNGRLTVDGTPYQMEQNEGPTCLHSGTAGFHTLDWSMMDHGSDHLTLATVLPDGACGLPGRREVTVRFRVSGAMLELIVEATTDTPTPMAVAHHPYWALGGVPTLTSPAQSYLPVDAEQIPTGEIADVTGTAFDFREGRPLPPEIDHNLCLANAPRPTPEMLAIATGTHAQMIISSTEPGLQVYSGSGLPTVQGTDIAPFAGCALEPQAWPNAANMPQFPSVMITPGSPYRQVTQYTFGPAT